MPDGVVSVLRGRDRLTPLWIIALFLSLAEVAAAYTVIQTIGIVQIIIAIFVMVFPIFVSSCFFAILWNKNYVLFPPGDYGPETDVARYVEAMQRSASYDERIFERIE